MDLQMLSETVSARGIQRGYKKVFNRVKKTKKPVVVVSNNTPQAAIISLEMLEEFNKLRFDRDFFLLIDQIRAKNTNKNPKSVLGDVTGDVEAVRKKIYEEAFGGN